MEMDKDKIITSLPNGKEKKLICCLEKVKAIADGKMTLKDIKIVLLFYIKSPWIYLSAQIKKLSHYEMKKST